MKSDITRVVTPLNRQVIVSLRAGDRVELSGEVLVFRDEVHRILCERISRGEDLPFDLENAAVYYCGPTPARLGRPVGSAGPTTSARMDRFTGPLLECGLAMTIGKGDRSPEVRDLLVKHRAVYLVATGGAGALIARHITASRVVAYPELGPEAARIFTVRDLPLIVGLDSCGGSAFMERVKSEG
ncbi:MAG: FumA C-terminus/TtdB family hydratase beta subunit [Candidatus Latescibacterota bacterium]